MNQAQTLTRKQDHRSPRVYPELVMAPSAAEREATYYAALKLVARIDNDLTQGLRHYRTRAGKLLKTLDEVIRAILDNDLVLTGEPADLWPMVEVAA